MLRDKKYSQFDQKTLDTIREIPVEQVAAELGGDSSGRHRRLQVVIAWLKTDPKIGKQVTLALQTCPFTSTDSSASALRDRITQLEKQLKAAVKK